MNNQTDISPGTLFTFKNAESNYYHIIDLVMNGEQPMEVTYKDGTGAVMNEPYEAFKEKAVFDESELSPTEEKSMDITIDENTLTSDIQIEKQPMYQVELPDEYNGVLLSAENKKKL